MAKLISFFPFLFTGKLGDYVGTVRNGQQIIRKRPIRTNKNPTVLQQRQHRIFSILTKFLKPLIPLFDQTFNTVCKGMSCFNKAVSINIRNAIAGEGETLSIDYSKIILGKGNLLNIKLRSVTSPVSGTILLKWNLDKFGAHQPEKMYAAIYCEPLNSWIYDFNIVPGKTRKFSLNISSFSGYPVHAYIGSISENGKKVSDSQYTGMVNVL